MAKDGESPMTVTPRRVLGGHIQDDIAVDKDAVTARHLRVSDIIAFRQSLGSQRKGDSRLGARIMVFY